MSIFRRLYLRARGRRVPLKGQLSVELDESEALAMRDALSAGEPFEVRLANPPHINFMYPAEGGINYLRDIEYSLKYDDGGGTLVIKRMDP